MFKQRPRTKPKIRRPWLQQNGLRHSVAAPHWLDVWLSRLSHFAQFGLFLFTVGSLYFTVIPLYKTAALEESIARKEFELGQLNKIVDDSYGRMRVYMMDEYYRAAAPSCSGLFTKSKQPNLAEVPAEHQVPRAETVYAINVAACLKEKAGELLSLKGLRPRDRAAFDTALAKLGADLMEIRKGSLTEYQGVESRISDVDVDNLPQDSMRVQWLEQFSNFYAAKVFRDKRHKLAVEIAKEKVGMKYEETIRDKLRSLRDMKWPEMSDVSRSDVP